MRLVICRTVRLKSTCVNPALIANAYEILSHHERLTCNVILKIFSYAFIFCVRDISRSKLESFLSNYFRAILLSQAFFHCVVDSLTFFIFASHHEQNYTRIFNIFRTAGQKDFVRCIRVVLYCIRARIKHSFLLPTFQGNTAKATAFILQAQDILFIKVAHWLPFRLVSKLKSLFYNGFA